MRVLKAGGPPGLAVSSTMALPAQGLCTHATSWLESLLPPPPPQAIAPAQGVLPPDPPLQACSPDLALASHVQPLSRTQPLSKTALLTLFLLRFLLFGGCEHLTSCKLASMLVFTAQALPHRSALACLHLNWEFH